MTFLEANKTLGVIGCGTMGEAIVHGLLRSGALAPNQIFASDARAEVASTLASKHGIRCEVLSQATEGDIRTVVVRAVARDGERRMATPA